MSMTISVPRTQARSTFTDPVRIALLEGDMDETDSKVDAILTGQNKLMWWAMGIVASLSTTSVLLVINLVR